MNILKHWQNITDYCVFVIKDDVSTELSISIIKNRTKKKRIDERKAILKIKYVVVNIAEKKNGCRGKYKYS